MQRVMRSGFLLTMLVVACAFTTQKTPASLDSTSSQPPEERAAQDALPQAKDPLWGTLLKTKIHVNEKKGLYSATFPPEVKALEGKQVTISGFMLPVETSVKFKHFILAKRTPTCPFCPPGEPNEIIDVTIDKNVAFTEKLLTVTGTFGFMNNQQFGMFFKMTGAKIQ